MLQLVVLKEEAYKMIQAANMTPLAEHARVLGDVVAKLKLKLKLKLTLEPEALARMLWMIPAHSLHSPFFVAAVEAEAASLCAMLLFDCRLLLVQYK